MGITSVEGSPSQNLQTQGECSQIAKEVPFVGSEALRTLISISLRRATLFTSLIDIAVAVLFWVVYHITLVHVLWH